MLAKDIMVGGHYVAKVGENLTIVRVDSITERAGNSDYYGGRYARATTRYNVTNLVTGRSTTFRSAAKFRRKVEGEIAIADMIHTMKVHKQMRAH